MLNERDDEEFGNVKQTSYENDWYLFLGYAKARQVWEMTGLWMVYNIWSKISQIYILMLLLTCSSKRLLILLCCDLWCYGRTWRNHAAYQFIWHDGYHSQWGELECNVDTTLFQEQHSFGIGMCIRDRIGYFIQAKATWHNGLTTSMEVMCVN